MSKQTETEKKSFSETGEKQNLYSTGEMAKFCGVTVRTVQYYDKRGILVPSDLTEGGRRIYNEEDLEKLRLLCFLREMGLSIDHIKQILEEDNSGNVIGTILEEHIRTLKQEVDQQQEKLRKAQQLAIQLKHTRDVSVGSMQDIAYSMKTKKELKRLHGFMLAVGIFMDLVEIGTLIYAIKTGNWIFFLMGLVLVVACGIYISVRYYRSVDYICPECHFVFRPGFREAFFARHTPKTRKLTCPHCLKTSFCIETYGTGQAEKEE